MAFETASLHDNFIEQSSIDILQRLRDDFMSYLSSALTDPSGQLVTDGENEEDSAAAIAQLVKGNGRTDRAKKETADVAQAKEVPGSNRGDELSRRLRRIVYIPVPVLLDTVPSAAVILRAMDRIFRAYVRGNALPGQTTGGNTVDLDGKQMSLRTFVLHGPYMSWRGFIGFLFDFAVAKPPPPHTRSGKNYLSAMNMNEGNKRAGGDGYIATGPDPPLELKEAGAVFIESSHSATPALVLSKYLRLYEEIAEGLDYDPWSLVASWANDRGAGEWHLTAGLNFMQFVDCLGVSRGLYCVLLYERAHARNGMTVFACNLCCPTRRNLERWPTRLLDSPRCCPQWGTALSTSYRRT